MDNADGFMSAGASGMPAGMDDLAGTFDHNGELDMLYFGGGDTGEEDGGAGARVTPDDTPPSPSTPSSSLECVGTPSMRLRPSSMPPAIIRQARGSPDPARGSPDPAFRVGGLGYEPGDPGCGLEAPDAEYAGSSGYGRGDRAGGLFARDAGSSGPTGFLRKAPARLAALSALSREHDAAQSKEHTLQRIAVIEAATANGQVVEELNDRIQESVERASSLQGDQESSQNAVEASKLALATALSAHRASLKTHEGKVASLEAERAVGDSLRTAVGNHSKQRESLVRSLASAGPGSREKDDDSSLYGYLLSSFFPADTYRVAINGCVGTRW